jgi:integrase
MAPAACEAIPREVPVAKPPKKPAPLDVEPPRGPTVHAKPVRPPTERLPHWYWRAVVYDEGAERTVWTGRGSREDVRAALWELIGRGAHIQTTQAPADMVAVQFVTLADLLQHWRAHLAADRADLAPGTITTYTGHARVIEDVIGAVLLDTVGRQDLDRYRGIVARSPGEGSRRRVARSAGSIAMDFTVLAMAWAWGRAIGACPDVRLDVPAVAPKPVRDGYTPTAGEVGAVLGRLDSWRRDIVQLQWATGCRVGELAALLVGDVDLQRAELVVGRHVGAQKTGQRRVPLHRETVALLRRMVGERAATDRLWPVAVQVVRHHLNPSIRAACEALNQPVWTTHGLRRAFIIRGVRAGVDVATLATITGHRVEELLATYRQVQDLDRRAAVELLPPGLPRGEVVQFRAAGDPHSGPAHEEI